MNSMTDLMRTAGAVDAAWQAGILSLMAAHVPLAWQLHPMHSGAP